MREILFVAAAKENGQSQRFLLKKAIEHYLHTRGALRVQGAT
jgi:hypothetical protein